MRLPTAILRWANTYLRQSRTKTTQRQHHQSSTVTSFIRHKLCLSAQLHGIGVGSITSSAVVTTVNNARDFKNGRQMVARLGLVSRQVSSGGKTTQGGFTKRGNTYLRALLY